VFDRFISIDWSGAKRESKRSGLRIVQTTLEHGSGEVVDSPERRTCWWKRAEVVQGYGGTGSVADRLNPAHQLKSRFGYGVQRSVSVRERRQRLGRAVSGPGALGLQTVAKHIAFLINFNLRRYDDRMLDAIERWESDLDWLYQSYYEGKAYSFVWPETD
jgi:hypothetical protein